MRCTCAQFIQVPNPTFKVKGANERPHIDGGVSFHLHSCQPDHLTIRPDLMQPIWDRFKSAIDPILKVLHVPSLESVIMATSNVQPVSKEENALLFAISYSQPPPKEDFPETKLT
jgi:hypothetical protein